MGYKYGFGTEKLGDGTVGFVMTGDGYTQFHDVVYSDDPCIVGLAISYGEGDGTLGKLTTFDTPRHLDEFDVGYIVKFHRVESIDSMIAQLERCKSILSTQGASPSALSEDGQWF